MLMLDYITLYQNICKLISNSGAVTDRTQIDKDLQEARTVLSAVKNSSTTKPGSAVGAKPKASIPSLSEGDYVASYQ